MATKKPRKKKSCQLKRTHLVNEAVLKNYCVLYIADGEPNREIMLCDLQGNQKPVSRTMAISIEKFRYKWSLMLCVYGREKNGKIRCEHQLVTIGSPLFQSDLVEFLNDTHKQMIADFSLHNEAHGAAWVASAVDRDWNEEEVENILIKNGVELL